MAKEITSKNEDYSQWYLDIIKAADLAEYGPARGSMIIKPYGYAIWENIQKVLDEKIKKLGAKNAYFPLFIPESYLKREAKHVEGFAPECAVVTYAGGEKLAEPLVVRPTSETIIYETFSKWISSYRDLPLIINQWANVVRWELRPRLFLRTTEFLWQEGHTAFENEKDADKNALEAIEMYKDFVENYMAIPVAAGQKTEAEKFAGAVRTYSIEAMMQDGRALQMGTSHLLGQNFAKSFNVKFAAKDGREEFVYQTSWGVSTRLIGGMIMAHSDDKGLVLPPKLATYQVVIIPVSNTDEEKETVLKKCRSLKKSLEEKEIRVHLDEREGRPGPKFFEWEKKGVPLRIEIGPRDLTNKKLVIVRRDENEKQVIDEEKAVTTALNLLDEIQKNLFKKAQNLLKEKTKEVDTWEDFKKQVEVGFALSYWCGSAACEEEIKQETKATIRNIPFEKSQKEGKCLRCGNKSETRVIFAKAY